MTFTLRLLGGASIEGPDGPLTGRATQRHRLALLAMLGASRHGGITRDKLVAYLWPESDDERARRSLSDSVYRINKALGEDTVLSVADELRLDPGRLPSDVAAFREAVESEDWEGAAGAYGGPFLDGFHLANAPEFGRWLDGERDRLARLYAAALESLAQERADAGDLAGAATIWRRRADHDPYDSRVSLRLMEALEAAGNRAGALQHARIHAQLLEQEFGTGPGPEVLALEERLRSRGAAPPRTGSPGAVEPAPTSGRPRDDGASTPVPADPSAVDSGSSGPESARRRRGPWPYVAAGLLVALATWLAWGRGSPSDTGEPPSVAVLPFESLSADEGDRFFADGVTEDILTTLSRVPELRVIARPSVAVYQGSTAPPSQIARELGVRYLVQGSVRRSADEVRITARLVDATTNVNVWAQTYDRRMEDIFAVQGDIARRVAAALETELGPDVEAGIDQPPTDDLVAYNLYLRGRFHWHRRTEEALLESAQLFEQAVQRDPGFARAWAGLADAYAVLAFYDYLPPAEAYPRAEQAARRALDLDDMLAEAHASLGYITLYHGWDAPSAEAAFRRATQLNPGYSIAHQWYANLLVAVGRFDAAEREMSRAREVNPLSQIANAALGWVYYYAGRYEDTVRQCDLALEMDPGWDLALLWRGIGLDQLGRRDDAIDSLRRAVEASGGSGITRAALAHALARAGRVEESREMVGELTANVEGGRYQPSFEIAKAWVALGEHDTAIAWLEQALEERSHSMVFLEVDPQLAPVRGEAGFRRLVDSVNLDR